MTSPIVELRDLAERPENHAFAAVLIYCADEIARLRRALEDIGVDEGDPNPDEPSIGAADCVAIAREALAADARPRFDIAKQGYPPELAGGTNAYLRRNAFFAREQEKDRRKVELELLSTLFRERFGEKMTPQILAMLDEAYIASQLAMPPLEPKTTHETAFIRLGRGRID